MESIKDEDYQKIKNEVAYFIRKECAQQGIVDLNNKRQLRLCMELVGMQCNKNNFCSYHGYKRTEYMAQQPLESLTQTEIGTIPPIMQA